MRRGGGRGKARESKINGGSHEDKLERMSFY